MDGIWWTVKDTIHTKILHARCDTCLGTQLFLNILVLFQILVLEKNINPSNHLFLFSTIPHHFIRESWKPKNSPCWFFSKLPAVSQKTQAWRSPKRRKGNPKDLEPKKKNATIFQLWQVSQLKKTLRFFGGKKLQVPKLCLFLVVGFLVLKIWRPDWEDSSMTLWMVYLENRRNHRKPCNVSNSNWVFFLIFWGPSGFSRLSSYQLLQADHLWEFWRIQMLKFCVRSPNPTPPKKIGGWFPQTTPVKTTPTNQKQLLIKIVLNALVSLSKAGYKTVVSSGG